MVFTIHGRILPLSELFLLVVSFIGPLMSRSVVAQSPTTGNDPQDYAPELLKKQFLREAEAYEIEVVDGNRKLTLQKQPLLNWQNPERPSTLGSLFVWFDGTRPAVIASVFTFQVNQQLRRKHEVLSLFSEALVARLDGEQVWNPRAADLRGIDVPLSSTPHASEGGRLTQMRAIAREVLGKHHPRDGGPPQELRLLSQPMLRYQSESSNVIDGAIFALAVGTDPEIMLLIEARKEGEQSFWKMVPLRSHFDKLELQHAGKLVWTAPLISELMMTRPMSVPFANDPFFVFYPTKSLSPASELKEAFKN